MQDLTKRKRTLLALPQAGTPHLLRALGILVVAVVAGCGTNGPELVPAKGTVVMSDGHAVMPGTIAFVRQDSPEEDFRGTSLLGEGGSFTMRTYPHGDGVPPGKYKVTLSLSAGVPQELLKYTKPDTTTLEIEIGAEGDESIAFVLPEKMPKRIRPAGPPNLAR